MVEYDFWAEKTIDGLDGNKLLKAYALSIEDKMAAGAFGRATNNTSASSKCRFYLQN